MSKRAVCTSSSDPFSHVRRTIRALLLAVAVMLPWAMPSFAASPRDYDVPGGHYYEQAAPNGRGFVVSDDDGVPLWGEFRRLGGVRALGYPISHRYQCDRAVCQVFEYAVFKWSPGDKVVELLNVFDQLHRQGRDDWLEKVWGVPPWDSADGQSAQKARKKEERESAALLEANRSLKSAYARLGPTAATVYGLARAYRVSEKTAVLRTQRAALVQSLDTPGLVELLRSGQVFRDAGLVPPEALGPVEAPKPGDATPPTRIKMPDLGVDAEVIRLDMGSDGELPIPDNGRVVAWYSYGARLGEGGNAVLAGHVDWNREVGVFFRLGDARPGQTITLSGGGGQTYEYRVEWVRRYLADSPGGLASLWPSSEAPTITLITCGGRFDVATRSYEDRQVVRAILVSRN